MIRRVLLAGLLTTAVHAQSSSPSASSVPTRPSRPVVDVYFQNAPLVRVQGPEPTDDSAYGLTALVPAPTRQLTALHWCWEALKFWGCQVQLVGPQTGPVTLKTGSVRQVRWTPDERWLVGMGDNTLRLWDPSQPDRMPRTSVLKMNGLVRLDVGAQHICVTGRDRLDAVYTVLTWPDLTVVRAQRVPLFKDVSATTRQGNQTTTTLNYEPIGTFAPPPCT